MPEVPPDTPNGRYDIPAEPEHCVLETIKRSRFICTMTHAPDMKSARDFVARTKARYPDATHNCWAFVAGPPGDTARIGMSDDGEPHGTAGRPMLNVLLHSGVGEVACVVTRYFGGTKLGTGGLVRAYSGMVSMALETMPRAQHVRTADVEAVIPYDAITLFKRLLPEHEARILHEQFDVDASFSLRLPASNVSRLETALQELTNGNLLFSTE